jgi:hypothetical protein
MSSYPEPVMDGCIARIEKLVNGYEVEVLDPDQQKKNQAPKSSWKDPWKGYAFSTKEEVVKFLEKVLDKLQPEDESYDTSFSKAIAEDNDD